MKTRLLIIIPIIIAIMAVGVLMIPQEQETENGNYEYGITGEQGGAGSHTKTDLIFSRTSVDDPSRVSTVNLTNDLHYTGLILFWDWQIRSFENYVFVSWVTSEQSWSDVFLAVSDDFGKTFDVKNISQNQNYIFEYKIDYSNEAVYIVWIHEFTTENDENINHIYFTKSDNFGESFGQQKLLSTFDKSSYEFDLEAFDDNVFVVWRQDTDSSDENNVWFAASTDKAEYFHRNAKLLGGNVDVDSFNDILHLTWVSVDDNDQIWYAYSEDLGNTLESRIISDADWETSPYAPNPIPKITAEKAKIMIDWRMNNEQGEDTPYKIIIFE